MGKSLSTVLTCMVIFVIAGCQTADQKIPEIATAYCNCLRETEKGISDHTREIMLKASNADEPDKVVESEMEKLSEEDKMSVATEMVSVGKLADKSSEVYRCMTAVDDKYSKMRTLDQKKFYQKLIKELESMPGCSFTAVLMKIGMKESEGKGKD